MSQTAIAMTPHRHRFYEDLLAIPLGSLMVSIGVVLFAKATVLTGGAAGLALLLQFALGWNFSVLFFVINLPFYWLALRRMGLPFTLRTIAAVALISFFVWATPLWLRIESVAPLYAAIAGGVAMGLGLLALARHRTAIGGVNILALYLQERHGMARRLGPARHRRDDLRRRPLPAPAREGRALARRHGGDQRHPGDEPQARPLHGDILTHGVMLGLAQSISRVSVGHHEHRTEMRSLSHDQAGAITRLHPAGRMRSHRRRERRDETWPSP